LLLFVCHRLNILFFDLGVLFFGFGKKDVKKIYIPIKKLSNLYKIASPPLYVSFATYIFETTKMCCCFIIDNNNVGSAFSFTCSIFSHCLIPRHWSLFGKYQISTGKGTLVRTFKLRIFRSMDEALERMGFLGQITYFGHAI
jgi:hypothetical protein